MQVSVDVTDDMRREAESRGLPVVDYIDLLIQKGRQTQEGSAALTSAIDRIRALRSIEDAPRR